LHFPREYDIYFHRRLFRGKHFIFSVPSKSLLFFSLLYVLGTALLDGCGCGDSQGSHGLLSCAGNGGEIPPQTLGSGGGTITSADGKASMVIPEGALSGETTVSVDPAPGVPAGIIENAYSFGASGTLVNVPVVISIQYDPAALSDIPEANLRLARLFDNSIWILVADSAVDAENHRVSGSTFLFGVYGIFAVPNPPGGVSALPGDQQVTIRWDPVPGAASYNLYTALGPGVTKQNGIEDQGVSSPFTKQGLINGQTYYFVVTAQNNAGESAESSEVNASPN
jgi:hypothetical protein